jgi:signal transduction histidine kinase
MDRDLDAVRRLAFDLHDGPLQTLAAFRRELEAFRDQLAERGNAAAIVARVADLEAWMSALDEELRDVISAGAAPELWAGPLGDALSAALETYRGSCSGDLDLDARLDEVSLTDVQRVMLVRIVQAAVSNAARHSGGARIGLSVRVDAGTLEVEVADAGAGFDVDRAFSEARLAGRLGLEGMRDRARRLGGELRVVSGTGTGTRVLVRVPFG